MEMPKPQQEHLWLQRFLGEWDYDSECSMGPDAPPAKTSGTQSFQKLGDVWIVGDWRGECPDGSPSKSIITLGYDPAKNAFVGTFVSSMMTGLWIYEGQLKGDVLTLDTEGPSFKGDGSLAKYQDVFETVDENTHKLTSRALGEDGTWTTFMTADFRRRK